MTPPPVFAPRGDHQPRRRLGDQERRAHIQVQQPVEGCLIDFEKRLGPVEPGIVYQDVERAETGNGVAHRGAVGHVERQCPGPATLLAQSQRQLRRAGSRCG